MREIKVLLIEDNLTDARLVQGMLAEAQTSSFQIHTADCLVNALDALTRAEFDVALVDLTLPDSQGIAFIMAVGVKHVGDTFRYAVVTG